MRAYVQTVVPTATPEEATWLLERVNGYPLTKAEVDKLGVEYDPEFTAFEDSSVICNGCRRLDCPARKNGKHGLAECSPTDQNADVALACHDSSGASSPDEGLVLASCGSARELEAGKVRIRAEWGDGDVGQLIVLVQAFQKRFGKEERCVIHWGESGFQWDMAISVCGGQADEPIVLAGGNLEDCDDESVEAKGHASKPRKARKPRKPRKPSK